MTMRGTVKWFDVQKGYGFITDDSEGRDVFVHYSNLKTDGFKTLHEDDFVSFEIGTGKDGREQAVNVQAVLTMKMIDDSLKKENLYVKEVKADANTVVMNTAGMKTGYMVVNENNVIQVGEHGMSFLELAAYAGFSIEGLSK